MDARVPSIETRNSITGHRMTVWGCHIRNFLLRQVGQLRQYGPVSYIRMKLDRCVSDCLCILLLPVYIFIRVIRPLIFVRFGELRNDRIGHFASNIDFYLCQRDHGLQSQKSLDIFCCRGPVCNNQLLKMWKRVLRVNPVALYFFRLNKVVPGGDRHEIKSVAENADERGLIEKSRIHVYFTPEEEREGRAGLIKVGIGSETPFICLFARDSAYLDKTYRFTDWKYHDYRNCNIQDYRLGADELAGRGYYVIRVGSVVNEPMATDNPKVIDYSCNGCRTELLDIYLPARCRFFVSGGSAGLDSVPGLFRKPVLYVDYDLMEQVTTWNSKSIITFKRLWLKSEHRFLTFGEILESGFGKIANKEVYDRHGIEHINSTPDEILDAVIEMEERLRGTWITTEEDEYLQERYRALFKRKYPNRVFNSRIGARFLRDNKALLG